MNEIILSDKKIQFKTKEELVSAWLYMSNAMARAKELKAKLEGYVIDHFQEHKIKEIEIGGRWLLKVGNKKKETFKTEEIYDLFSFTDIQRRILPKNPDFKKTALKIELGDGLGEFMTIKFEDKLEVNEVDKRFIKPKEQKNGTGTTDS
jgi:hypothetical protein